MGKRDKELNSSIRVKEEDEKVEADVLRVCNGDDDDDDDAEANEDLSLKIVERAFLLKDSDAKSDKAGAVKARMVATLKDGLKVTNVNDDNSKKNVEKVIKKVIKKVKKKVKKGDTTEAEIDLVSSEKDNGFKNFCSDLFAAGEAKQEEKTESDKDAVADIVDNVVQMSPVDNHVLRKLLRGPRYFDPPENGWGTCYNCGEEGHMTVNCTSARPKKPCFVCGSLEHNAKQCSKGQNCFVCKKQGHRAKNCPEKNECSQISKFCLKCGENGHDMFSCRGNYCPDDLKEIQCYVCGVFGHLCCKNYPDTGPREVSCYRCGFSGHTGLACAQSRGETTGSGSVSSCFKCGGEGHFARECTNSKAVKRGTQVSSTKQRSVKSKRENPEVTPSPSRNGKGRKKRKANYEERFLSSSKSKQKNGWTTEHPGDFHNSNNGKNAGWVPPPATPYNNSVGHWGSPVIPYNNSVGRWGSPVTPYNNNVGRWGSPVTPYNNNVGRWGSPSTPYNNNYAASGHASTSYPSRYPGPGNFGSSSSNGYRNGHASQFGNYSSGGDGRHHRW